MNIPFTYHSQKDHCLLCVNLNSRYQLTRMEVWDEYSRRWIQVPDGSNSFAAYLAEIPQALDEGKGVP